MNEAMNEAPTSTREKGSEKGWADWLICAALFLCLSALYFATAAGITSSNDGSHYALTRAIAEQGRFEIGRYDSYAEGNDLARRDGKLFSDRPPGTAMVASLFYTVGRWLPAPPDLLPSRHDAENPLLFYVMLLPAWAGAGTVVILYRLLRDLEISIFGALTTSLMFGLGTAHWKYSSVLFSHALSSFTVMLSVYLIFRATARAASVSAIHWTLPLFLGFVLGCAVLVEYSNALLVVVAVVYLLIAFGLLEHKRLLLHMGLLVAGGAIPAAFLAYYNTVNFGGPFTLSYAYAINYPWAGDFRSTFNFPLAQGLRGMLIWGEGGGWCDPTCYNQGLFLLSPVTLLSIAGLVHYFRRRRREFILTVGLFLIYLGLFSKHRTFHGFTADGRYLVPFLGLWAIPMGFFFDRVLRRVEAPPWCALLYLAVYGLFCLSLRNMFLHIGFSYNYQLDLSELNGFAAAPGNWSYLMDQVFRNADNLFGLPLSPFWALTGGGALACSAVRWAILWAKPER